MEALWSQFEGVMAQEEPEDGNSKEGAGREEGAEEEGEEGRVDQEEDRIEEKGRRPGRG